MTREEAITRIKDHIEIHRYHERNAVKIFEALDMAIKALEQEPCDDAVSREAAIEKSIVCVAGVQAFKAVPVYALELSPSATPKQKTGEWIDGRRPKHDGTFYFYRECSRCGYERDDCDPEKDTNFCPNCGIKMS